MACVATGLSNDAPHTPPVTTTQKFTYTGADATDFFSAVPLVTNRAKLMTYTPGAASLHDKLAITEREDASTAVPVVAASSTKAVGTVISSSAGAAATATSGNISKSAAVKARRVGSGGLGIGVLVISMAIAGSF